MKKKLIIIDVSNFIFRAFYAIRLLHSPDGVPVNAVHGVLSMFLKLFSKYRPTHVLLAKDTSGGSFRNELYDQYKANRSAPPDDLIPQFALIQMLIEKMELKYCEHQNYEADDIIGSAVIQWKDEFDEILIASGDKDLMQFVGDNVFMVDTMKDKVYDSEGVFEKMRVYPHQIVDYLSMVGDASDNIPGMKGIGAKGAAKLLAEHKTLEACIAIKDTFKGKKLTNAFENHVDDALLSKELIEIKTDVDICMPSADTAYEFYPSEALFDYLKGLGFRSALKKLEDIKEGYFRAQENNKSEIVDLSREKFQSNVVHNLNPDLKKTLKEVKAAGKVGLYIKYKQDYPVGKIIEGFALNYNGEGSDCFIVDEKKLGAKNISGVMKELFEDPNLELTGIHFKDHFVYARENKIELKAKLFDISQAHYIIDADSKHTLKNLSDDYLGLELPVYDHKKVTFLEIEELKLAKYLGERAKNILALEKTLREELVSHGVEKVYDDIDSKVIPILAEIEREGVYLNKDYFKKFEKELTKEINGIEKEILSHGSKEQKDKEEAINLNSPKQVGDFLFGELALPIIKKTKTGASTDSEVLQELVSRDLSPVPALLLKYRELGKLLSTYVKVLPGLVCEETNRVHAQFNQNVAATGRLSSSNPNLQNIPIRTELGQRVRGGFIAEPGKILLGADYSQVELRLLAHFSDDQTMIKTFNDGRDIHRQTASEVLGIAPDKITSSQRSQAKAVNFGLMYGQSSFGLAKQLRISRKEAKEYITHYFNRFSQIKGYLDSLKEECEKLGYAQTLLGRKRFLPNIHSSNRTIKAMAERVAINSPIQGTAADIIKLAMIKIDSEIKSKKLKSKMILQVHDELIFEVMESELDAMKSIVKEGMENVVSLKVPLTVDMGSGVNWLSLK